MRARGEGAAFLRTLDRAITEGEEARAQMLAELARKPLDERLTALRDFGLSLSQPELARLFESEIIRIDPETPSKPFPWRALAAGGIAAGLLAGWLIGTTSGSRVAFRSAGEERFYGALAAANEPGVIAYCQGPGRLMIEISGGRQKPACLLWMPDQAGSGR